MVGWLLFALGVVSLALTVLVLRPLRWPTALGLLSFWFAWTTGDLPVLQVVLQGIAATALAGMGALETVPGALGMAALVSSWGGLFKAHAIAHESHDAMEAALAVTGVAEAPEDWQRERLWRPFPFLGHRGVRVKRHVEVARHGWMRHTVDVFYPAEPGEGRPVLVFAHGGGWVISFREFQGLPVIHRLVERGWVVVRTGYRLSPWVHFPAHLVDVKQAIAWARQNAHRWGGDPARFLGIHGNSAGAHLAALCALTPNDPRYQPGFEEVDTSVDACVPVYGPLDLLNRHGDWGPDFDWFLRLLVIGRPRTHEIWREASPIDQIKPGAPPFLLVHGELDTLVPVTQSHRFVDAMRAAGNVVDYAEIPGGQHALDIFHSRRGVVAADGIVRWLVHTDARRSRSRPDEAPSVERHGVG